MSRTPRPFALPTALACLPLLATAAPLVQSTQAFTELVGPNPYFASGWMLGIGATNISPSGAGTSVEAVHTPADPSQDYAIAATPSSVFPNAYLRYLPYTGQAGSWEIRATDASGTGTATTHALDDIRQLPLLSGLGVTGNPLAPTVFWDRVDPGLYPSGCVSCAVGFDFFNYSIVVRDSAGTLLYQSAPIRNDLATPTSWTLPAGVLAPGTQVLIGFRLTMSELERINPNGSFTSPLENRSSAYLVHDTAPVPEPAAAALLLAGLASLGAWARRRERPR